ncbi:type VI secretion system baseplate subunit TssF [Azospirillum sp. TSH64]|uniref:type VI secretion system baseplate subunit TssF n=1 Tax=Azospirillum sp. TSH64 TaxID=652740 RepID=UPI0018EE67E4|nr:type VI secretion system baseplate subunit TssF [Azospirillum sp. TSH64]
MMHPQLLRYYDDELRHLREVGAEFAEEFPKIAGRLALEKFECADPYVERMLEAFAFLTARVQIKMEAQFPRFINHLLEVVYPHYLAPTPSMAVVRFQPDLSEGGLASGFLIPRGDTVLRSVAGKGRNTACEYRTGHDVTLWPIELIRAEYLPTSGAVAALDVPEVRGVRAGLRLRLKTTAGLTFDKLALDRLPLFLSGAGGLPVALCEQILGAGLGMAIRPAQRPASWQEIRPAASLARCGFSEREALLPTSPRSFDGYRLLHEYFSFPARFQFVELRDLSRAVRRCTGDELEIVILFSRANPQLDGVIDQQNIQLFCAPAVNLFPKRADRIHLNTRDTEHHIVPDRTRPLDFEVHSVLSVAGYGAGTEVAQEFKPFYAARDQHAAGSDHAFYALSRQPRVLSAKQRRVGPRSSYIGSEAFVSLVDGEEAPYGHDLRQLGIMTLCTNRDLPLHASFGQLNTDFTMDQGAPVESIRCVAGPSKPRPSNAEGVTAWRLISHLSLNYLSLADSDPERGSQALRDLLKLYTDREEASAAKQVDGVRHVRTTPIVRRVPGRGHIVHARGLEVSVTFDEHAFDGSGIFLLGAVLEEFFAKYVSLNSFTETVIHSLDRGEVMRWPARIGRRELL